MSVSMILSLIFPAIFLVYGIILGVTSIKNGSITNIFYGGALFGAGTFALTLMILYHTNRLKEEHKVQPIRIENSILIDTTNVYSPTKDFLWDPNETLEYGNVGSEKFQ